MKQLFSLLLLLFSLTIIAQTKIYLDENWKETTQDKAHFYRLLEKKSDSLYYIEDYYINGNLQMDGHFSNLEKETFEGELNWYDKNGEITTKKHYINGKENGVAIGYLPNGQILSKGTYKNGKPINGLFADNCSCSFQEYKDGVRTKEVSFYIDSNQPASERYYKQDTEYGDYPTKDVFYDKNNRVIGTMNYSDKDYYSETSGTSYEFYQENERCLSKRDKIEKIDGKPTKVTMYDKSGKVLYEGVYQDGKSYDGDFISNDSVYFTVTNKDKGIIQTKTTLNNEDFKLLYKLTYKDGEPYNGKIKSYEEIKIYKNGKLTVLEEYYNANLEKIKSRTVYAGKESVTYVYNEYGEIIGSSYVNNLGLKNGLELDGNIRTQYKNNQIVWIEQPDFTIDNKMLHCDYKEGKPYNGIKLNYQDKHYYKNGKKEKIEYYRLNYDTEKYYIERIEYYKDNHIVKKTTYVDDKAFTIVLKSGNYYEGELYDAWRGEFFTYKNGEKEGYYAKLKGKKLLEEGNYSAGKINGIVTYFPTIQNKKTTCVFENGIPINGTVSTELEKTTYKNGKKNGICIEYNKSSNNTSSIITSTYLNGLKEGKETVVIGDKTYVGFYKNGKAFSGDLFDLYDSPYGRIQSFKNGKKHGEFTTLKNNKLLQKVIYNEGVPVSEKTIMLSDDEVLGEGFYKNKKCYNGTFVKHIELDNYSIITYKKGKIREKIIVEIKQKFGAYAGKPAVEKNIIEKYTYKKGLKDGAYISTNSADLPSFRKKIKGVYKKDKPFSGEFTTSKNQGLKIMSTYKNGLKEGTEYYETLYNHIDSLFYKKGEITHGKQLELLKGSYGGYFFTHHYNNGKKIKTQTSKYIITYQEDNNFTVNKEEFKGEEKVNINAQVVFSNKEQTAGKINYFVGENSIGTLFFNNGELTKGNVKLNYFKKEFESVTVTVIDSLLNVILKPSDKFKMYYKMIGSNKIPQKLTYHNFENINNAFSLGNFNKNLTIKQYLNDGTFLLEMKMENKRIKGTFITFKERHGIIVYKISFEGENRESIKDLTYDELLEEIKKINKK